MPGKNKPICKCVLRSIFRRCLSHYRAMADQHNPQLKRKVLMWHFRSLDYRADFWLTARRSLAPHEFSIFRRHLVAGEPWFRCCRRVDRGNFYHAVYRIEAKLGRAFKETQPYALYPPGRY